MSEQRKVMKAHVILFKTVLKSGLEKQRRFFDLGAVRERRWGSQSTDVVSRTTLPLARYSNTMRYAFTVTVSFLVL